MVTHGNFKYQKSGSNRSGKRYYWTCGEKPYTDCKARAMTEIEEEEDPDDSGKPIQRHRLVSVSMPQVNLQKQHAIYD